MDAKIMQRLAGYRAGAGVIDILVQLESSRMPSLEIKTLPMRGILPAKSRHQGSCDRRGSKPRQIWAKWTGRQRWAVTVNKWKTGSADGTVALADG
jgi:hypothetical protein